MILRYFPVDDLVNIYKGLYGKIRIDGSTIISCSSLLFAEWIGEKFAGADLFTPFASKSPFLVEKLHSYFLGKYCVPSLVRNVHESVHASLALYSRGVTTLALQLAT